MVSSRYAVFMNGPLQQEIVPNGEVTECTVQTELKYSNVVYSCFFCVCLGNALCVEPSKHLGNALCGTE